MILIFGLHGERVKCSFFLAAQSRALTSIFKGDHKISSMRL
jgi:hypothetical protein